MKYKNVKVKKLAQKLFQVKKSCLNWEINQTQMRHKPHSNFHTFIF